ncbi:MAG: phosphotransferase family protein [Rhodobacteraceae bacterium]|nr:phosphotransferase family protein [Paracoccaceae bacterium]
MTEDWDTGQLGRYLAAHVPGFRDLRGVQKFDGGQSNPTYLLTAGSGLYVLRRKPSGVLLKSAHAVDREFRVIAALAGTAVPVPETLHLCEDPDVMGAAFYVMSFVRGRTLWDPSLPDADVAARGAIYDEMNRVLAAIHGVDIVAAGLADFGKPGNYFERQFTRWTGQYRLSETGPIPAMEAVIRWLGDNMVADDGRVALVHGDYRLDNFLFAPEGTGIVAVLDWELSTLGHPFADLAYQCALWRMPPDAALRGLGGVDRKRLGIPEEADYVARYCARTGIAGIDNWPFYLAFSLFRMAAIVQGVKKRALDGNAASGRALAVGALAEPLAQLAADLIDGRHPRHV